MRTIDYASQFKRDYKREKKGRYREILDDALMQVVELLASDSLLEPKYCDHALSGDWKDFRDCHIKPDLILIYQKPDADTLRLVRLGSHSELGLYTLWISRCIATARERIPGSIDNYVTGVSECSQQRGNLKDDGYRSSSLVGVVHMGLLYVPTKNLQVGKLVITINYNFY